MKEFFKKIVAWIKENKLISIIIASALTLIILLSIILPLALGGNKDSSSENSESLSSSVSESVSESDSESISESVEDSSSEDVLPSEYTYKIFVGSVANYGFKDASVKLMDGNAEIASDTTNGLGYVTFDVEPGSYDIVIDGVPAGYKAVEEGIKTIPLAQTESKVEYMPQGVITGETAPAGKVYALGDVMYDFSIVVDDNTTFTLSEVLKEKDMLLLNFWATWCGPCQAEFPAMNSAAIAYSDSVAVLAVSTTDSMSAVQEYKKTSGLTFDMAEDSISLQRKFNLGGGIPFSVIIDRYGVVVFSHLGSMQAVSDFTSRFDLFCGEDYTPTVIEGDGEDVIGPGGEEETRILPNVEAPALSEVSKVLDDNSGKFEYRWQYDEANPDEYSWPWLVSDDKSYLYTPTSNIHPSYAALYIDFTAKAGDTISFDYIINSEADADYLYVMIDQTLVQQFSGAFVNNWRTCVAYVFKDYEAGEHTLSLIYQKDGDTSAGDDMVKIKNLCFGNVDDLNTPSVDANIFRYAATVLADSNSDTKYENYVDVVLSDVDGYYHVGSEDGPILFASMMQGSQWSPYTLWDLALNDYCVCDGVSYKASIEDFAWEATNNMVNYGYTPVTEELKVILDMVAEFVKPKEGDPLFKDWDGEWHENEWLEFCCYYDHYGDTPQFEDPMKTITFHAAQPLQLGSNEINVPYAINPRGFKYKFIPETSGVYNVYSTGDKDTVAFLFADDRETMLGFYDDLVAAETYEDANGVTVADGNFNFYYYMEAGKTYYLLFTTFLDQVATYNTEIAYVGATYNDFVNAATGPYSFNDVTMETYIPNAVDFEYADPAKTYTYYIEGTTETKAGDGYYHVKNKDGSIGSILYLDVNRPTAFFNSATLYDTCREAQNYAPEKRAFYINGVDYTNPLQAICFKAMLNSGDLKGFAAVDKEVYDIIAAITHSYSEGIYNSWLMLCYYYDYLGY